MTVNPATVVRDGRDKLDNNHALVMAMVLIVVLINDGRFKVDKELQPVNATLAADVINGNDTVRIIAADAKVIPPVIVFGIVNVVNTNAFAHVNVVVVIRFGTLIVSNDGTLPSPTIPAVVREGKLIVCRIVHVPDEVVPVHVVNAGKFRVVKL